MEEKIPPEAELAAREAALIEKEAALAEKESALRTMERQIVKAKHGLYGRMNVSLKTMDMVIGVLVAAMLGILLFGILT